MARVTKVSILYQETKVKTELKPIEFKFLVWETGEWQKCYDEPKNWDNVILLCRGWRTSGLDLMFAIDDGKTNGFLALGHFNDGIV